MSFPHLPPVAIRITRWIALLVLVPVVVLAQDAGVRPVAKIAGQGISVAELEQRLSEVPSFQLETFGPDKTTIRRRFLEDVLVAERLFLLAAEKRAMSKDLRVAQALTRLRANAALRALRKQTDAVIEDAEVARYYEAHRDRFQSAERIRISRILCASKEDAEKVAIEARRDLTLAKFTALARERSVDKSTYLRAGDLGFVRPDGATDAEGVRIDPAVVRAATQLKDGELAPAIVAEGAHFAVIWRRGHVAQQNRTLAEVAPLLRDAVAREKFESAEDTLVRERRAAWLAEVHEELLAVVELSPFDAGAKWVPSPHDPQGK